MGNVARRVPGNQSVKVFLLLFVHKKKTRLVLTYICPGLGLAFSPLYI